MVPRHSSSNPAAGPSTHPRQGTHHEDVLGDDFVLHLAREAHAAPAIAQRDGDRLLRVILTNYMLRKSFRYLNYAQKKEERSGDVVNKVLPRAEERR